MKNLFTLIEKEALESYFMKLNYNEKKNSKNIVFFLLSADRKITDDRNYSSIIDITNNRKYIRLKSTRIDEVFSPKGKEKRFHR